MESILLVIRRVRMFSIFSKVSDNLIREVKQTLKIKIQVQTLA